MNKALLVSDSVSERSVCFFPSGTPEKEIFSKLVRSLSTADHDLALNAILERENRGGTIIDTMVSIPHARLAGLKTIQLAVGILTEAPKDRPRIFFLFLSPKEDSKVHLFFLSGLSSLFQSEGFLNELLDSKAPHEIIQKIREIEKGI